jgi:hypothetical protein
MPGANKAELIEGVVYTPSPEIDPAKPVRSSFQRFIPGKAQFMMIDERSEQRGSECPQVLMLI